MGVRTISVTYAYAFGPSGIAAIVGIEYLYPELASAKGSSVSSDHITWVAHCPRRMETVKAGMTRGQLLHVFRTEGGLSTRIQQTFVSQDCPYFKVDVDFKPVGREDTSDIIVSMSRPYLQFTIAD
jgi:hypothetical protein